MPVATQLINNIVGNRLNLLTSNFAPYWVSLNLIFLASKKVIVKNEKCNIDKVLKMVAIFIIGFVSMLVFLSSDYVINNNCSIILVIQKHNAKNLVI